VVGAFGVGLAPASAQTTTTTSTTGVPSIPVTPAVPAPTTTAPAASGTASGSESAASPLADTGIAADRLVPLGFLLIGMGAVLVGAARRYGRPAFRFL
jgi:hypothetical protein